MVSAGGREGRAAAVRTMSARMRFPQLFVLLLILLVADLFIPDAIPFVDEIALGLLTALFGMWKDRRKVAPRHVKVEVGEPPVDRAQASNTSR